MTDDEFGERIKVKEQAEAGRKASSDKPLLARLDGRAFHTFTRDLQRPYDEGMSNAMMDTMMFMVEKTHAVVGYVQSDEISLMWNACPENGQHMFDGKYQKLCSILASMCSVDFNRRIALYLPHKQIEAPIFDCRVWNVDTLEEAADVFVWRQADAIKNAISMAAQAKFSHKALHGKNSVDKLEMLKNVGVVFDGYPPYFRKGIYARRTVVSRFLTETELQKIPEKHRPSGPVERTQIELFHLPRLHEVQNRVGCLFNKEGAVLRGKNG